MTWGGSVTWDIIRSLLQGFLGVHIAGSDLTISYLGSSPSDFIKQQLGDIDLQLLELIKASKFESHEVFS